VPIAEGIASGLASAAGKGIGSALVRVLPVGGSKIVLAVGPSGAGKTALLSDLSGREVPPDMPRTLPGASPVRLGRGLPRGLDTAGQADFDALMQLYEYRDRVVGVLYVVADGLLVPRKGDPSPRGPYEHADYVIRGMARDDVRAECRDHELDVCARFHEIVSRQLSQLRFAYVVANKSELWWPSRDDVRRRYMTSDWNDLIGFSSERRFDVDYFEYSSVYAPLLPETNGDRLSNVWPDPSCHDHVRQELRRNLSNAIVRSRGSR